MPAVMTYALPALQLVCHLVSTGNSTISDTIPGIAGRSSINAPAAILDASPIPARTLPPGYVAYPDFGVAYKVSNETISWEAAVGRCVLEGAYLATIDTAEKIYVVRKQYTSTKSTHVGLYGKNGDNINWYNIHTGLASSNLPWASGEPNGSPRCVMISSSGIGLTNLDCSTQGNYVCQISYP